MSNATREPILKTVIRQADQRLRAHQRAAAAALGAVAARDRIEAYQLRRALHVAGASQRFPISIY